MTSPSPPAHNAIADDGEENECDPATPADTLRFILHRLLPILLAAALTARSLVGRWRLLHSKLSLLAGALADAADSPHWPNNPLFLQLLLSLYQTLRSLRALSNRCQNASLPDGKLRLQSDLDIAASSLALHLHDLSLLLRAGLLHHHNHQEQLYEDHHEAAALVLPLPVPSASRADLALFVRDLFTRLQIGAFDLKNQALESLLNLLASDPPKLSRLVAEEGDLPSLLRLLDHPAHSHSSLLRDRTATAVSLLATSSDASRRAVFKEGALGPLLRLLEAGSTAVKERAAAAIHAITGDPGSAWAVSAYGGIAVLVGACWSGSPVVQTLAVGSLKNIAIVDGVRGAMVEEGAVPALVDLLISGNLEAQKNAALCLSFLASMGNDEIRTAILKENGIQRLLQLLREASDPETIYQSLRAIHSLSVSPAAAKCLSLSPSFFSQLTDFIKRGNAGFQQTAAALVTSLSPGDDIKRSMAPAMASLVKMMDCAKPACAQEAAAGALVSLLAVRLNRKELSKDEKSISRLIQMLDPRNEEVGKKFPVSVVLALTSSSGARKRMAEAGACQHLQKLADAGVPGSKKAMQRISGSWLKNVLSIGWPQ